MTLTRRSFLKAAGLTVVAAAGASMFTGCSTFVNPEITVIYPEVDAATTSRNAKVVTGTLKVLFQHLVDDNYNGSIDTIKIVPENAGDTTIKYTKKDAAHYEMTVKFCSKV